MMSLTTKLRPLASFGFRKFCPTPLPGLMMQVSTFVSSPKDSDPDFQPQVNANPPQASEKSSDEVRAKILDLVKNNPVVLFMKGSPDAPQCGFSRAVVKILAAEEVDDYVYADVLKSPAIREGVKKFSDWPTIPQVYVRGEFIGGCDIITEMHKSGELKKLLVEKKVVE